MSVSGGVGRKVGVLALAYGAGLVALMTSIAAADSRVGAGIALAWILAVLLYARRELRCPLCGASVLNAGVGPGLRWLVRSPRRCPRCRTEYEQAASTRHARPEAVAGSAASDPKENST